MSSSSRGGNLSLRHPIQLATELLTNPRYFWTLALLVIIGDGVLTDLIIRFVPYTEIDWETYMVQTEVFLKGQHNYSMITGPTGPLVYPAGHLRIHTILHDITDSGRNIALAQHIYAGLYVATLALTCAIYRKAGTIPNWVLLILPLSKRLHSVFVLRLFNDCWAVLAVQAAILFYQLGLDDTGTFLFAAALSVKMSVLLYLPGLLVILFKRRGLLSTLRHIMTITAIQTLLANPFLAEDPWAYLHSAFDLSRVFLYKWTVNWRMVDEETFLSRRWAVGLLVGHVFVLVLFGLFRWCRADGGVWSVFARGLRQPHRPAGGVAPMTPDYVATVLFTSNLVGILFARSLHYQFYSWYALQVPFLAWKTPYPLAVKLALILGIEYAWNVFPATPLSSSILLCANALLLVGVWLQKDATVKIKTT
ncbi:glycosyltransferase family 58 protein [Lyophyllum atratum]|nr:glycosyltransferase family 58 protein [Lyophyllum atratum]